jgi:hypothetical protein
MGIKRPASKDDQLLAGAVFVYLYRESATALLAEYVARVLLNRVTREGSCRASTLKWGDSVSEVIDGIRSIKRDLRWSQVMASDGKSMQDEGELNKLKEPYASQLGLAIDGVAAARQGALPSPYADAVYDLAASGAPGPKGMDLYVTVDRYDFYAIFPCGPQLPTDVGGGEALLAATIFAEAGQSRKADDERKAIAWATINRMLHIAAFPADKRDLGDGTMLGTLQVKGAYPSYHSNQWLKVAPNDRLLTSGYCECLVADECAAMTKALEVAKSVWAEYQKGNAAPTGELGRVIAFNQATNSPPSPRMQRINMGFVTGDAHVKHTFYEFIPGRENPKAQPAPKKAGRGKK